MGIYSKLRALVIGFYVSYHDKETILFAIDPYFGNLNWIP